MSHHSKNWHMSDFECNSILSCDCSDDEDSSKILIETVYQG